MSIKNFGLATAGAVAGMIGGNYLYSLDKKANEFKEVPVPFHTIKNLSNQLSKETDKLAEEWMKKSKEAVRNAIKNGFDSIKTTCKDEEVHEMTDEEVSEELNNTNEQAVIDAEVVDGKAVEIEVDAEGNPVQQPEEVKVVGDTEEATIPQFTVVDQVPVEEPEKKKTSTKQQF